MVKLLYNFDRIKEKLFSSFNFTASGLIFILMILISIDVFGRVLFDKPFRGTPELISNSIIIITFLELPYVLLKNGHVRSTMIYDKLGLKGKSVVDIIASIIGIVVFYLLIKSSMHDFIKAVQIGEFEGEGALRVPTTPARFIILMSSAFMIIEYITIIIKASTPFLEGGHEE